MAYTIASIWLKAHSFPRASFVKTVLLPGAGHVRGQISSQTKGGKKEANKKLNLGHRQLRHEAILTSR